MNSKNGLRVALAGLGFGAEFIPIYLHHPNVAHLTICDSNERRLQKLGDKYEVSSRASDLRAVINSDDFDAVHLVTPIPLHAEQSLAVLRSGKHCACTVPAATTIEDLHAIVAAEKASGKKYMMMETAVYTRGFLFAKQMLENKEIGRVQFLRGAHYQDMEDWPKYWMGLPPMHYATHAVSPLLALTNCRATEVHCFGSGWMREELKVPYGNPYPVETAIFRLSDPGLAAEVTRSLFHLARGYTESFSIYGDKSSFEWQQVESEEKPVVFHMGETKRVEPPDRADILPPEIARFTKSCVYDEKNPHLSFTQGGGHYGSHPHMVHEFIRAIVENRIPSSNALVAANWTACGICAHASAMNSGASIKVPEF